MTFSLIAAIDEATDVYDRAAHQPDLSNAVALRQQQDQAATADLGEQLVDDNGVVICADCEEPINPLRLAAKPQAKRCVWCQSKLDGTPISLEAY